MNRRVRLIVGGVALAAVAMLVSTQGLSQEKTQKPQTAQDPTAEMMAKWKELNAKGPEHKKFEQMVGTWDVEMKMWMGPGEPTVEKGVSEFRTILDGRYIEQVFKCPMMGSMYEGRGIEGYDNFKKKYVSIWIGNDSTGISMMEGTADESGKVTTYFGKTDDPMTGKQKTVKSVAREITKDEVIFEMYETMPGGGESKVMEIRYTRRKEAARPGPRGWDG